MAAIRKEEQVHSIDQPLRQRKKVVKKRLVRRKNRKALFKSRIQTALLMTFCIAISSLILHRYASISEMKYEISDMESQIYASNLERDELQIELNQIKNSDWLKTQAETKVNLRPAKESQIVELSVGSSNQDTSGTMAKLKNSVDGVAKRFF